MRPYPVVPPPTERWTGDVADRARRQPLPRPMDLHGKSKLRAAAFRAKNVYPGPVRELVSRELLSFEDFGYVLAHDGLTNRLADHVLKASP